MTDAGPATNLARFADHYGFRHDLLAADHGFAITGAAADFNGRVERLAVTPYGRLGNIFYQLLNAVSVARLLGCGTIAVRPFEGGPREASVERDGLRILLDEAAAAGAADVPTLTGNFFLLAPWESALGAPPASAILETVRRDLAPVFREALREATPFGRRTLAMHFRAGDIFRCETIHPYYVQPPASYYLLAMQFARAELGVEDAVLVFEDRGNPAIAVVEAELAGAGIPFRIQSGTLAGDFGCLAGASHLVASFSTFVEAAAMLSDSIETYVAFRDVESHQRFHLRHEPQLLGVLRRKGVRTVLIDDAAGAYIRPLSWTGSEAQRQVLRDYPAGNLRIVEGEAVDRLESAGADAHWHERMGASQEEAARLRRLLIAGRVEAGRLREDLQTADGALATAAEALAASRRETVSALDRAAAAERDRAALAQTLFGSTSWRVTAPLRWAVDTARRVLRRAGARGVK